MDQSCGWKLRVVVQKTGNANHGWSWRRVDHSGAGRHSMTSVTGGLDESNRRSLARVGLEAFV